MKTGEAFYIISLSKDATVSLLCFDASAEWVGGRAAVYEPRLTGSWQNLPIIWTHEPLVPVQGRLTSFSVTPSAPELTQTACVKPYFVKVSSVLLLMSNAFTFIEVFKVLRTVITVH